MWQEDLPTDSFLIRLEAALGDEEGDAAFWDEFEEEFGYTLREELTDAVQEELPGVVSVQINFSRGSFIVWVATTLAEGVVEGLGFAAVLVLARRLLRILQARINGLAGFRHATRPHGPGMWYSVNVYVGIGSAAPLQVASNPPRLSQADDRLVLWALALLAQLALVFVVVWLLVA